MEAKKINERTLADINEILNFAKINEDDVIPTSQAIYFVNENLHENPYKLLQLNPELWSEIQEGHVLQIKGNDDDPVVICSDRQTFHVTEAETSNSLLLVKGMKFCEETKEENQRTIHKVEVHGIFYDYLEAVVGKPHLKRLQELLSQSIYRGPEHEFSIEKSKLYTFEELSPKIQASNKELLEELNAMDVITIDGKIRLLDFEYHFRVLSHMLQLIEENSWQLDEIDYDETMNTLQELVPKEILNSLFDKYAEETKIIDGLQLYQYKEDKVCQLYAKVLLHEAGKFNLNEFLQAWRESVPEGMTTREDMLNGIAIINRNCEPNVIWAFEESDLPECINERFKILFETKEKWSVPEITPYIKRLATPKLDVNALLAKYARASKQGSVKYYSAKHGK